MPDLRVTEPLRYQEFLNLMANAWLVLTDSGGVQEETTILGVPFDRLRTGSFERVYPERTGPERSRMSRRAQNRFDELTRRKNLVHYNPQRFYDVIPGFLCTLNVLGGEGVVFQ